MTDPLMQATVRPSQYSPPQPELKPMTPAPTQPSTGDSAKLDAIIADQKKMGRQLRLVTDLLVSALEDRVL
ncbi:hypothetical protein C1M55_10380 [Rhodococcus qingshengii]|uniref:hypothetical protein n=1 Tax=Rhodococcus qingshengii TaxID=334542 RepID=UPI000C9F3928|nr:hypothetical protein [Rhodococcus qingshengii]AUS31481.1 hypothetical protein C1M55_10380 [Rhodococcus qingshengii]